MAQFPLVKTVRFSDTLVVLEKADGRVQTYGISTSETPDGDNEICDYEDAKKQYQIWSDAFEKATKAAGQEVSKGNIRVQHGAEIGGKAIEVDYDDGAKTISLRTEAATPDVGDMLKRGCMTGMSHAGSYLYRRCNVCATDVRKGNFCPSCKKQQLIRYAPVLAEVSYVDNPCNPDARFTFVKATGERVTKLFAKADDAYSADTKATESKLAEILARLDQIAPPINGEPADKATKERMEASAAKFTRLATDAIQKSGKGKLAKGMFDVAEVAGIIQSIAWVQQSAVWEREWEKDASTLPEEFLALLDHAIQVFTHQVAEETGELTEAARAAIAAGEAAEAAEKTSKGANTMAEKNSFVKVFSAVLGVEKAHGLAHHIGKMAKSVKEFHAEGAGLHKAHHEAMVGHLEAMKDMEDAAKAAKAKGHLAKAIECADGHMDKGLDMHKDHAEEMAGHFGKMGKILGVEEADKWADEAADMPEGVGGEPSGATGNEYEKARAARKAAAAAAPAEKETFTKAEVGELIASTLGEFMKNFSEGIAAAVEPATEEPVQKRAPGIGDRAQVRFPRSGQGSGAMGKAADTAGHGQGSNPGAAPVAEPVTPADIEKAMRGDVEALKKVGLGMPGETLPDDVAFSMSMVGR